MIGMLLNWECACPAPHKSGSWPMPASALGKQKLKDKKFKVILGYIKASLSYVRLSKESIECKC